MAKTLFFEEVATATVVTTNTVTPFPRRPWNNAPTSYLYRYQYQVGRDEQTTGNYYSGDVMGHIPACPYHMPRNSNRYNDPRMFLPYKKRGDIIEANDLNKLYDRLTVFLHAWNAEINDVYNMGIVNKLRSPAAKNFMTPISSDKTTNGIQAVVDGNTGTKNVRILNKTYFQMFKADSEAEIIAKFQEIDNLNVDDLSDTKWLSHPIGNMLPYGVPLIIGSNGMEESPIGIPGTSEAANPTINVTTENRYYYSTMPHMVSDHLFHFGRCKTQNAYLEYAHTTEDVNYFLFVIDRDSNGDPIYWKFSTDGVTHNAITMSENASELIYTYRDYNEDPLNPKLYYMGIKIFNRPLEPIFDGLSTDASKSTIDFAENDISFSELDKRFKRGNYPIIKAQEWKNARLTIKTLLDRILSISTVAFSGQIDTVTKFEIDTFYSQQTGFTEEVDKDDPEALFLSYQAVPGAIIKVEFYNTLIDAYKLMVNSCICNTDCSCNINCVCNVNCGCNYG